MNLEQRIYNLEQEIKRLRGKTETWLTASEVLELTERDRFWLARKREDGIIKCKKKGEKTSYFYLLESIPQVYLKKQIA